MPFVGLRLKEQKTPLQRGVFFHDCLRKFMLNADIQLEQQQDMPQAGSGTWPMPRT